MKRYTMAAEGGIYVHIPFCRVRCPYCNFPVIVSHDHDLRRRYLDALLRSISEDPPPFQPLTLYLGGGTPSRLKPKELELLLSNLWDLFQTSPQEVTLEANPEDLDPEALKLYHDLGINRLSVGLERHRLEELKILGRASSFSAIARLPDLLKQWQHWGHRASVDIIYGIPGESRQDLAQLLDFLKDLPIQHLSAYALTVEDGTPMARWHTRSPHTFPGEDELASLYELLLEIVESWGWVNYEVSNFARSHRDFSRHNLLYWQHRPYWGYGLSAVSFVREQEGWVRFRRPGSLKEFYDAPSSRGEEETLTAQAFLLEALFLGLRSMVGIPKSVWEWARERGRFIPHEERGEVFVRDGRVLLTPRGRFLSDEIALRLYTILESEADFLIQFFEEERSGAGRAVPTIL